MPSTIDMHAHYVSRALVADVARHGSRYGLNLDVDAEGHEHIVFDSGVRLRPLFHALCDLGVRLPKLDETGVALQIVSPWTDMAGDDLPADKGARWARLQNETIADDVRAFDGRFAAMGLLPMQDVRRRSQNSTTS